ncbi:unnamed protein product [Cylicocyclus nassatus]|uniref:Tyrosyl-DNA phosphodiesterase n=1 Tax=Cylicocyclus nassatus TaxID=53992 RepID=A0AA36M9T5_CYLNA|nr:unnamed protein product [Cylicocyclus nassatus]
MAKPSKIPRIAHKDLVSGNLYFTKVPLEVDKLAEKFNADAFSFSDIVQIIQPRLSLHFSFMIDLEWLLRQYPASCRDSSIMCIVGDQMGTDREELEKSVSVNKRSNVSVFGAKLPIPYGTHHTKLSLFESETGLHIIVSTANLTEADWGEKTQCFYYAIGLSGNSATTESDFVEDLCSYLLEYHLKELDYWIDRIKSCDFSANTDRLVFSVPGYHHSTRMSKFGHPSLARLLKERPAPKKDARRLFILQCSSIGVLGDNGKVWLLDQFLSSLQGGKSQDLDLSKILLIFPSVEDVRNSSEGYRAGDYIPYPELTALGQTWLDDVMCKWKSDSSGRSKAMPHVKTYTELLDDIPQWLLVTSANLSRAAWGEYQKKNSSQFMVRSYELGVLITDPHRIKFPYDYPLTRYGPSDSPWVCDVSYTEADSHGEKRIVDED